MRRMPKYHNVSNAKTHFNQFESATQNRVRCKKSRAVSLNFWKNLGFSHGPPMFLLRLSWKFCKLFSKIQFFQKHIFLEKPIKNNYWVKSSRKINIQYTKSSNMPEFRDLGLMPELGLLIALPELVNCASKSTPNLCDALVGWAIMQWLGWLVTPNCILHNLIIGAFMQKGKFFVPSPRERHSKWPLVFRMVLWIFEIFKSESAFYFGIYTIKTRGWFFMC